MTKIFSILILFFCTAVWSAEFRVNSLADDTDGSCDALPDDCTLREAFQAANAMAGADDIVFDQLPGSGPVWRIVLTSALPVITDTGTTVDGWTAPGFTGTPIIELEDSTGISDGLRIIGSDTRIRGLSFLGFNNQINVPTSTSQRVIIQGNHFGTDSAITQINGANNGLALLGSFHLVGTDGNGVDDAIEGNLFVGHTTAVFINGALGGFDSVDNRISGNRFGLDQMPNQFGVVLNANVVRGTIIGVDDSSTDNLNDANTFTYNTGSAIWNNGTETGIRGNYIGVEPDGITPGGNGAHGILISNGQNHVIGGDETVLQNHISNNGGNGMLVSAQVARVLVQDNRIRDNQELAIKFSTTSTPRSVPDVLDVDTGPNELQNYPTLNGPARLLSDRLQVSGSLLARATRSYLLQFYISATCRSDNAGEAAVPVHVTMIESDGNGNLVFDIDSLPYVNAGLFPFLSATATDLDDLVTSEVSDCVLIDDSLFADSFE